MDGWGTVHVRPQPDRPENDEQVFEWWGCDERSHRMYLEIGNLEEARWEDPPRWPTPYQHRICRTVRQKVAGPLPEQPRAYCSFVWYSKGCSGPRTLSFSHLRVCGPVAGLKSTPSVMPVSRSSALRFVCESLP